MAPLELPENWQDLAAGYVLDNLDDKEQQLWDTLLRQYPELADEVEALQSSFNELADVIPVQTPPERVLAAIRSTIQDQSSLNFSATQLTRDQSDKGPSKVIPSGESWAEGATTARQPTQRHKPGWLSLRRNYLGGAIAVGMIGVLFVQLFQAQNQVQNAKRQLAQSQAQIALLTRELQQAQRQIRMVNPVVQSLQQSGTLTYGLAGSSLAETASGQLVLSGSKDVLIVVKNLPTLPSNRVYRLWANLPQYSGLVYCGQFNSNISGIIQLTPSSNQCTDHPLQMIITLDAITDPTTQGGPVVLQGSI